VRRILVASGFEATIFHNGESIVVCEREGADEPIPFVHHELFTPTMQEDVCGVASITLEEFEELRRRLCDPDPDFDGLN
jgi:hypothetical protein